MMVTSISTSSEERTSKSRSAVSELNSAKSKLNSYCSLILFLLLKLLHMKDLKPMARKDCSVSLFLLETLPNSSEDKMTKKQRNNKSKKDFNFANFFIDL